MYGRLMLDTRSTYYAVGIFVVLIITFFEIRREKRLSIEMILHKQMEVSPKEFQKVREKYFEGTMNPKYAHRKDFPGVYILRNHTKNLYYVGQAKCVMNRVHLHFAGFGNADLYKDYKVGNRFTIRMIALDKSGCSSLNELERATIEKYRLNLKNRYSKGILVWK